jgi:Cu(I)/Ag(I) efflux system membrane fusion protein
MTARARRWLRALLGAALVAAAALALGGRLTAWFSAETERQPRDSGAARSTRATASDAIDHYTCSMHPSVHQAAPGSCPLCGMQLIAVSREQQEQGEVLIDETRRQLGGVRVSAVIEAPFERVVQALGRVSYDESALTDVTLRVDGWVTQLFVARNGERVMRGQPLFRLYSPEIYGAEQDFLLSAQRAEGGPAPGAATSSSRLATSSRQRLRLLGLSDPQIDALAKDAAPSDSIPFASPASGYVIEKDVVEGARVSAGQRLYRIAALERVWVEADVPEADLSHVRAGQPAAVTLDSGSRRRFEARIAQVYPFVDSVSRRGRVRLELANPDGELRPGMYASVELATPAERRLQVPASAVIYTGPRRLVFVDQGAGRFLPREVRVGAESHGMYEVLEGLQAGESVASAGLFLIAAEARISTAAQYWESAPAEASQRAPARGTP